MTIRSAGILLYRRGAQGIEVLLVHPGGPFWRKRDRGAWSIPKGGVEPGEPVDGAARREFREELGHEAQGALVPLGQVRQRAGKTVEAFALEGALDVERISSNTFELEWPPRSGRRVCFPEVDRAAWFDLPTARQMILPGQSALLDRLEAHLAPPCAAPSGS